MTAARRIRVSEFIHQSDLGMPLQQCVEVHLLEFMPVIWNLQTGDGFEAIQQGLGFGAAMSFHDPDDNIGAIEQPRSGGHQHFVSFAHTGRSPEEHLEAAPCTVLLAGFFKKSVGRGTPYCVRVSHSAQRQAYIPIGAT